MAAKPIPELSTKDIARFWSRVDVRDPDECWPWIGGTVKGYGVLRISGSQYYATRIALTLDGRNPCDLMACHSCDNPPCCNPAHLFAGTNTDNVKDCVLKGRNTKMFGASNGTHTKPETLQRGSAHHQSKLTEDDVRAIRNDSRSGKYIGADYGVSSVVVNEIKARKSWTHVL